MKHVLALALGLGLPACSSSSGEVRPPVPASESTTTLSVGDPAPAFSLAGSTGATVSLASLTASGPAVLVFYRGDW
ncbi:MAG: redoxin domain-containing protein [Nannocystaceae bacterium]|nr:redoxin domain-containing protein [Nannocystaceae bacterium]